LHIVSHVINSFLGKVTQSNCVRSDRDHSNFQVLVGHADINEEDYLIDVTRLVEHEGYDDWEIINDVAVLNIDEPLVWSNRINHVDLPLWNYYVPSGRILTVSGWGDLEYDAQEYPDILMSVEVPALSNPECQDVYDEEEILEQHICAGAGKSDIRALISWLFLTNNIDFPGGIDACHGDSGKDQIA